MNRLRKFLAACLFALPLVAATAGPVNINTADSETLVAGLNGVGPQKAMAIVRYRQQHGPFRTVDDLALVNGIGAKTLEQNRSNITLASPEEDGQ